MFLRLSPIFVFVLSFDFGALKSIANFANGNVSDNSLGNIEHITKYSIINLTNFPPNESNINRYLLAPLLVIGRSGVQANDKNQAPNVFNGADSGGSGSIFLNANTVIFNAYPPPTTHTEMSSTTSTTPTSTTSPQFVGNTASHKYLSSGNVVQFSQQWNKRTLK